MEKLESTLLNLDGSVPLAKRFRALFALKALGSSSPEAVSIISKAFSSPTAGPLLKHELAYCLGQTKSLLALPTLIEVLENQKEDRMVRHEAAEAIGAIGQEDTIDILNKFISEDQEPERCVRETCEIAIDRIRWEAEKKAKENLLENKSYTSIDPAPPSQQQISTSVEELKKTLLDPKEPLFERYRAMFALRNIGSAEAVDALASGFSDDSALFKHEIAFIFGQLLSPHSIPSLLEVLKDEKEDDMVRHEAAEALGGIATPEVLPHLKEWMARPDAPKVVRESCEVAIDMWEYENSGDFQYADTFSTAQGSVQVGA